MGATLLPTPAQTLLNKHGQKLKLFYFNTIQNLSFKSSYREKRHEAIFVQSFSRAGISSDIHYLGIFHILRKPDFDILDPFIYKVDNFYILTFQSFECNRRHKTF